MLTTVERVLQANLGKAIRGSRRAGRVARSVTQGAFSREWVDGLIRCLREAIDYREVLTPKNGFTVDRRSPTDLFLMDQSRARGLWWQCFPDTVDPRGPKGK